MDLIDAQNALKKYEEAFPRFNESRECKFVVSLIGKLEENDMEGFSAVVADYDSISTLDPWFSSLLLRLKQGMDNENDMK